MSSKNKGLTVTKIAATGIAAYLAYRIFKKQQGAIHGLLESAAERIRKKQR